MAEVKWIKLTTDMFDNKKIKHIRRMPEGNNIVLIWVMLLTMAGRCNASGFIFLTANIPYDTKMLADELGFEESVIQLALGILERFGMIQRDGDLLSIPGWEDHQNIEGMEKIREQNKIRKQRQREKEKLLLEDMSRDVSRDVTQQNKKENKNKSKKERKTYSANAELNEALLSFIEFRKGIKKPMTERAIDLLIKKLDGLASDVEEQIEILNNSIVNGWTGVYALKERPKQKPQLQDDQDDLDDLF